MMEQASATIGMHHGLTAPVLALQALTDVGMKRGAGALAMVLAIGELVMMAGLDERNEPVPVQKSYVVIEVGKGMPLEEMVMEVTGLARRVVMADVVIIDLRDWNVDHAENHHRDSQGSRAQPINLAFHPHRFASMLTIGTAPTTMSATWRNGQARSAAWVAA
jgi:hypothetical protein